MVWLSALCGCNQVYGLDKTESAPVIDAQYFDAPADAPFTCPAIGMTPGYSRVLHQIIQNCKEPSVSTTGRAVADCSEPVYQIAEGPVGEPLVPVAGLEDTTSSSETIKIHHARYAPEGDELMVRIVRQAATNTGRIVVFARSGAGFVESHDVTLSWQMLDSLVTFGTPSRGPRRRMFVYDVTNAYQEIEFDSTGVATLVDTYTAANLGVASITSFAPNMTPDGLRAVFGGVVGGESADLYIDRANLGQRFSTGRVLPNLPFTSTPFMTDDCARIYFSGFGSMFWVQQQ